MELRNYLKIIGKRIWLFIVLVLIVTAGSYFFTFKTPSTFKTTELVNVMVKQNQQNAPYYQYDNYYSNQSGKAYSDTIYNWINDQSNIAEIYSIAQIDKPNVNTADSNIVIASKKKEPSTIQIVVTSEKKDVSESLATASLEFVNRKVKKLMDEGVMTNVTLDVSNPYTTETTPNNTINMGIGFAVGLIFALVIIFLAEYLKESK